MTSDRMPKDPASRTFEESLRALDAAQLDEILGRQAAERWRAGGLLFDRLVERVLTPDQVREETEKG